MSSEQKGMSNPMTPDQSKAQVMDGAQDIVRTLEINVVTATFSRSSCNDQHVAPFRGVVDLFYPRPDSLDEADSALAKMAERLRSTGWGGDTDFQSHGTTLTKNNVVAVLYPANVSVSRGHISVYGECRDMTTTKDSATTEDVIFD